MSTATNEIQKNSISELGYNFVAAPYLPAGENEYYLRNFQNKNGIEYRQLSAYEIKVLIRNNNSADNWNNLLVSNAFNPELVKNCKFYGLVRIGKLEPFYLEFSDLKVPVGIYNSTIISSDFGDNVVINNVNYLSHYIIGSGVIITNVNELVTSPYAKFGNGILKDGEDENTRIWLELCNENAGRKVILFDGLTTGDAYLWTKYRDNEKLLQKFKEFTEARFDKRRGYYGKIGDRTVIKNCKIIKDVWVGEDAYLKGANKLKNLTVNSGAEGKSQIGEGCEMVNGIMDYGCRAFYGVKAVRFVMASHSQLKYGARLINSYLGNNSTISCCEVLNSLIFPAHEQHHNNSFLCASTIKGQSNIAAGATIGSNHNSRSADGEIVAGRGFWPGLCVSLKHNSKFASFTILAKGDYPAELNIPIPFSLVSNNVSDDQLIIMPGYWFMYNMYALERNAAKYIDRDKRNEKAHYIEYDYLAPDSVNEMAESIKLFEKFTGKAWFNKQAEKQHTEQECMDKGRQLLEANDVALNDLEIVCDCFENTKRKVIILKVVKSYLLFKELISCYCVNNLLHYIKEEGINTLHQLFASSPLLKLNKWINVGGQLIPATEVDELIKKTETGEVSSWDEVHKFYKQQAELYNKQKLHHSIAVFLEVSNEQINMETFADMLNKALKTRQWMTEGIYNSRAKDYTGEFRKMVYENQEEMDAVTGKLEDNSFIKQQREALSIYKEEIAEVTKNIAML